MLDKKNLFWEFFPMASHSSSISSLSDDIYCLFENDCIAVCMDHIFSLLKGTNKPSCMFKIFKNALGWKLKGFISLSRRGLERLLRKLLRQPKQPG